MNQKEGIIVCINQEELINEYVSLKEIINQLIENKIEYYNENPFKEKEKKIWIEQIKENIILLNKDYKELEIIKKEEIKEIKEELEIINFTYKITTNHKDGSQTEVEKVSVEKITDYLLDKYSFKTIYGSKNEIVYNYKEGIWIPKGRPLIKTQVEYLLNNKSTTHIVNEVYEKIKRRTEIDIEEFNNVEEGLICLKNGIYDLKKKKFSNHSPKYNFKTKIPIFLNPKADCPNIKKFFEEILYEEDIPLIQEWFGYNLYNVYFEKKAVILFGDTNTGKTITLELLDNFLGENNTTSLSLQNISHGKSFDLLDLKDKYANIYDDLGDKDINDTGGFKIATGGSSITGEQKFGDRLKFKTFAKLTYGANKIPAIKDVDDDAYYNRWMPIRLDNQIPEKDQDKFLKQKLITEEELSGLFNWCLIGINRLFENNKFSFNKSVSEIKDIMQRSSHHLVKFSQDCLVKNNGNRISKELMFQVYSEWCDKNEVSRFTKDKLSKNLERFIPYIISSRDKVRVWVNVSFTDVPLRYDNYVTFLKIMRDKNSIVNKDKKLNIYNNFKPDVDDNKK